MKATSSFEIPILLIIYNRSDTTERVFSELRKLRPANLYIAGDGPKDEEIDRSKCAAARAAVRDIDWPCKVEYSFGDGNLGCGVHVHRAISWFFDNEPEGIVLEDDTLPNQSFFPYCRDLLERYRDDERIMLIGGNNFQKGIRRGDGSYYFSKYPAMWGWASWRRAWQQYDYKMAAFPKFVEQNQIANIFNETEVQKYWSDILDSTYRGKVDTWDYQWLFAIWRNNGLCITPNVNLVSNIGCGHQDATHTDRELDPLGNLPTETLEEVSHPSFMIRDRKADAHDSAHVFLVPIMTSQPIEEKEFEGDYSSWEDAVQNSSGYGDVKILEKVKEAALKVRNGEAVYERDSVLFDKVQYSWPLLSGLLWIASKSGNKLNIVDYGGALGTSYIQNKAFLSHLAQLTWHIVEQEDFIDCGKEHYEDEHLKFHRNLAECLTERQIPNAVILSGVLQYLEFPFSLLDEISDLGFEYLLIDRTPFSELGRDQLAIQRPPSEIYEGTFPHWFFDARKFRAYLARYFQIVEEFESSIDQTSYPAVYKGFILKRLDSAALTQPQSLRSRFFSKDLLTANVIDGLELNGFGPIEGPYPQWDLPEVRWALKKTTKLGFLSLGDAALSDVRLSVSFRPQVRSTASMIVKFNGLEIKKYHLKDGQFWVDDDFDFKPQMGANLIEFEFPNALDLAPPLDSHYMLFRKVQLDWTERHTIDPSERGTTLKQVTGISHTENVHSESHLPRVSVVVCTYNRADSLRIALDSLSGQTVDKTLFEIIVVNNNCSDHTPEVFNEFLGQFPNYRIVNEQKQGLSHARNRGYLEAKGRYVAYIDDDAKAHPGWLEEMISFTQRRPNVVAFGGPYFEYSLLPLPKWLPPATRSHSLGEVEHALGPGEWIHGCNMVFCRATLEKHGGFNPELGMKGNAIAYGEETDLLMRIRKDSDDVFYVPRMHVEHLIDADKCTLRWHLKSYYSDGKYSMAIFKEKAALTAVARDILKSIGQSPLAFFRERGAPLKRRVFYALRGIFYSFGQVSGLALKKRLSQKPT